MGSDNTNPEKPKGRQDKANETINSPVGARTDLAMDIREKKSNDFMKRLDGVNPLEFKEKSNQPDFVRIDVNESAEKQQKELFALAGTTMFELFPALRQAGFTADEIENLSVFQAWAKVEPRLKLTNPDGINDVKLAYQKIQMIIASNKNGEDAVHRVWMDGWSGMLSKAKGAYRITAGILDGHDPKKAVDQVKVPPEEKGFFDEHPLLKYAALGAGLLAGVHLARMGFDYVTEKISGKKADEKSETGFFGGLFDSLKYTGLLTAAGWGIAQLLHLDVVKSILKKLGIEDSKIVRAFELLRQGEFEKAGKALFEDDPKEQENLQICNDINNKITGANVRPNAILEIGEMNFKDWVPGGLIDQALQYGGDFLQGVLDKFTHSLFDKVPFLKDLLKKDPQLLKQLQDIKQYLALPENQEKIKKIDPGSNMKVRDVLKVLAGVAKSEDVKAALAPAAVVAVVPVGKVGAEVQKKAADDLSGIKLHHKKVGEAAADGLEFKADAAAVLEKDLDSCFGLLDEADQAHSSWWAREKEYFHNFFLGHPDQAVDEADFVKLLDSANEKEILQGLRSNVAALREMMKELKGKKFDDISRQKFLKLGEEFYSGYEGLKERLDYINQDGIRKQEQRIKDSRNKSWYKDQDRLAAGALAVGYGFFGLPISVGTQLVFPDSNEKNGVVMTVVGGSLLAYSGYGAAKGAWQGKGVFGKMWGAGKGFAGGAVAPLKFVLKTAPVAALRSFEIVDYYKTSEAIHQVRMKEKTVSGSMAELEEYLAKYGLKWSPNGAKPPRNGEIKLNEHGTPSSWEKFKSKFKVKKLPEESVRYLEEQLQVLQAHKDLRYDVWNEQLARKEFSLFHGLKNEVPDFIKAEESLIAKRAAEIERAAAGAPHGTPPMTTDLARQQAIQELIVAGEITTTKEAGKVLKDTIDKAGVETLSSKAKIDHLENASKQADLYLQKALLDVKKMKIEKKPQAEIEAFQKEVELHLKDVRKNFNTTFEGLNKSLKNLPKEEQAAFGKLIKERLTHATGVRGLVREIKGRGKFALVFGAANVIWDVYKLNKEQKEAHVQRECIDMGLEIGFDTLQLVFDIFSPFGISDWYTLVSGKEMLTQKTVGGWDRASRALFGTYNLVTDALAVVGGGVTAEVGGAGGAAIYGAENLIETGLRAGGKGPEVFKTVKTLMPRIVTLAKDVGGFPELAKILKTESMLKAIRGMEKTKKVAGAAMWGYAGLEIGKVAVYAGYDILFDTKDQPEFELDLPTEAATASAGGAQMAA